MTFTVLAVIFLLVLVIIAFVGQKLLSQKTASMKESNREQCAICRMDFDKSELIERQIGDFKIMYFCKQCIEKLHADLSNRYKEKTIV